MTRAICMLAALALAGCTTTCPPAPPPQVRIVDHGCDWIGPLLVTVDADHDTIPTIKKAIALKNAYAKNCHAVHSN